MFCWRSHAWLITTTSERTAATDVRRVASYSPGGANSNGASVHDKTGQSRITSPCVKEIWAETVSYHLSLTVIFGNLYIEIQAGFPAWQVLQAELHFFGEQHFPAVLDSESAALVKLIFNFC